VREVAAVREVHAEDRVAVLKGREVDRHVGLRPRVRLHVGVLGAEDFLRAVDGRLLDHVRKLAPAVVALAGIPFRVLVREDRPHRFEHGLAHEILGGDQFQPLGLPPHLVVNRAANQGVNCGERRVLAVVHRRSPSRGPGFS
jgi:hypothetical protein